LEAVIVVVRKSSNIPEFAFSDLDGFCIRDGTIFVKALTAAATDEIPTKEVLESFDRESAFTSSSTDVQTAGEFSSHSKIADS
jgi:hypothetical protein